MHLGLLKDYLRILAGDLSHSRSVSRSIRPLCFGLPISRNQEFIYTSLAENNKELLDQISKLVTDAAESIKRSSMEAADDH